jgi:hypothetical protein
MLSKLCNTKKEKLKEMIPTFNLKLEAISSLEEVRQYQEWKSNAEKTLRLKS